MAAYSPPAVSDCATVKTPSCLVQLHISCNGLFSKSINPLVTVYSPGWGVQSARRTERITNDQNPRFTKAIEIDYNFEETQQLQFFVYDMKDEDVSTNLHYRDLVSSMECTLGEIVCAGTYTKELKGKNTSSSKDHGTITISAEEVSDDHQLFEMKFSAHGLDKMDLLGKSDPFLEFEKENTDGSYTLVYKTTVIKKTLNPSWPPIDITSQALCNSNPDRKIRVRCYDWDADSSNDLIGEFYTSLPELSDAASGSGKLEWEVINPAKQAKKKGYKNSGTVQLESIKIAPVHSLLN